GDNEATLISVHGTTLADLTTGPDGNVWFTGAEADGQGVVGNVTPAGEVATFELPGEGGDIVAGKDGNLYVGGQDAIWRVSTAGNVSVALQGSFKAESLTSGADGSLW